MIFVRKYLRGGYEFEGQPDFQKPDSQVLDQSVHHYKEESEHAPHEHQKDCKDALEVRLHLTAEDFVGLSLHIPEGPLKVLVVNGYVLESLLVKERLNDERDISLGREHGVVGNAHLVLVVHRGCDHSLETLSQQATGIILAACQVKHTLTVIIIRKRDLL